MSFLNEETTIYPATSFFLGEKKLYYWFRLGAFHGLNICNEHGTIYAISSDFGDRMTMQSMGLMVLLRKYF